MHSRTFASTAAAHAAGAAAILAILWPGAVLAQSTGTDPATAAIAPNPSPVVPATVSSEGASPTGDAPALPTAVGAEGEKWRFTLAPYLWIPAYSGTAQVGNTTIPVDITQRQAFESLQDLEAALSLHFEAKYDKWSLFADGMYVKLGIDGSTPASGNFSSTYKQGIFEFGAAYRICDFKLDEAGTTALAIEPLAGVRIYYFDTEASVPAAGVGGGRTISWADAFGGVRGRLSFFSDAVGIFGRFDVGGGGSDTSWNAITGVDVRLAHWCSLLGGYRWLSLDYNSSGSGPDLFSYDVLMQGPFMAFEFRF